MKGGLVDMKQKSKWLWLFLLLFVVALVGCTSKEKTTVSTTPDKEEGEKIEEISLTIGSWRTEDVAKYEKVIELFNEQHPKYRFPLIRLKIQSITLFSIQHYRLEKAQTFSTYDLMQLD